MKQYYVYLLTNKGNTVLYTGMTNDLQRRLYEHREGPVESFTKQYHVHKLVAETFLVKVDGKNYIDHINGIKTDNRIDNLRWCTPKENANFELSILTESVQCVKRVEFLLINMI